MKQFHLHLVSDSTGETVNSVSRSVLAQFEEVEAEEHLWSLVRTPGQMEKVLEGISEEPGVVIYTIVNESLQQQLRDGCREIGVPCIPVLNRITREMSAYLGIQVSDDPGKQYELDDDYFARIEAINFALAHDDGQMTWELEDADIVLVGPSRTSKTPTCVYLSYRGYYAANVPYVSGVPLPDNLMKLRKPLIIGLIITPERLVQIRKSRLLSLKEERETDYIDIAKVKSEVLEARKFFKQQGWPVIDVTRRSIEETVANIINVYQEHQTKRQQEHAS